MTDNEQKLIRIIRESNDPEAALVIAVGIITDYLRQPELYRESFPASLGESS